MQEFNRGILHTLRELYNQDNVTLPRKTVASLLDQVLRDEEDAETDTLAGIELLLKQAGRMSDGMVPLDKSEEK